MALSTCGEIFEKWGLVEGSQILEVGPWRGCWKLTSTLFFISWSPWSKHTCLPHASLMMCYTISHNWGSLAVFPWNLYGHGKAFYLVSCLSQIDQSEQKKPPDVKVPVDVWSSFPCEKKSWALVLAECQHSFRRYCDFSYQTEVHNTALCTPLYGRTEYR